MESGKKRGGKRGWSGGGKRGQSGVKVGSKWGQSGVKVGFGSKKCRKKGLKWG